MKILLILELVFFLFSLWQYIRGKHEKTPAVPKKQIIQPSSEKQSPAPKATSVYSYFKEKISAYSVLWISGIALAPAVLAIIKYGTKIDVGMDVILTVGTVLSIALLGAANWLSSNAPSFEKGQIAQALAGIAIGELYLCIFFGVTYYHPIPAVMEFSAIFLVMAIAILCVRRHGIFIALLGVLGMMPVVFGLEGGYSIVLFITFYYIAVLIMSFFNLYWLLAYPLGVGMLLWLFTP